MTTFPDQGSDAPVFERGGAGPLAGVLVADFGRVLAAPYCTMLLADMGATVIKVESPAGDDTRSWAPPRRGEDSTYFLSINRNKHSIALDLADEDDARVARRLARRADVVVENFKPGGLRRFQLDYDAVAAANPQVVYASITGFGTAGGAHMPGYDLLVQAMSGMMSITGAGDTDPFRSGIALFDVITGLHAATGILAALRHRDQTGQGQLIELNLMSSALSGMVNQTAAYVLAGVVPQRVGNEHPSIFPYGPFPTSDGDIVVAIGNDGQYRTLCASIGRPELATDPRFASAADRSAHRDALRPLLREVFASRTTAQWCTILEAARLPNGPILDIQGGIEFAERIGLQPVVTVGTGPDALPGVRNPIGFTRTPVRYDFPPPALNADGPAIRRWLDADAPELVGTARTPLTEEA